MPYPGKVACGPSFVPEDRWMRRLDVAWLLVGAAISSAIVLSAARDLSAFGEPFYLRRA